MLRTSKAVRSTIAAAAYLVAAGCSDGAVAPRAPGSPNALRSGEPRPAVVPNRVKYRDSGAHPAAGRMGAASLAVRALVGKSGVTTMELTTAEFDVPSVAAAPGVLGKVQVKVYESDGTLQFVDNHPGAAGGYAAYSYAGLARGTRFQVQASVREPSGGRTQVITVSDAVWRRPDLAVGALSVPASVHVEAPVNIAATVREVNGDVGARTDCVLLVDDIGVDRAAGIWVDAGGIVTCAFTHSFSTPGVHRLAVRLEGAAPADDDARNDGAAGAIEVTTDPYGYSAWASDLDVSYFVSTSSRTTNLSNGQVTESGSSNGQSGHEQSSGIYAEMARAVTYPLTRVEVSQTTRDVLLHAAAYDNVLPNANSGRSRICFSDRYGTYFNARLFLCAFPARTTLQYARWAGDVSYFSESYARTWDVNGELVEAPSYSFNISVQREGAVVPWGDEVTIRISIDDDGSLYNTVAVVPLQPYRYALDWPLACSDNVDKKGTFAFHTCYTTQRSEVGVRGTAGMATP